MHLGKLQTSRIFGLMFMTAHHRKALALMCNVTNQREFKCWSIH